MIAIGLAWVGVAILVAYAHHRARMRRAQQPPLRRGRLVAWSGAVRRAP